MSCHGRTHPWSSRPCIDICRLCPSSGCRLCTAAAEGEARRIRMAQSKLKRTIETQIDSPQPLSQPHPDPLADPISMGEPRVPPAFESKREQTQAGQGAAAAGGGSQTAGSSGGSSRGGSSNGRHAGGAAASRARPLAQRWWRQISSEVSAAMGGHER